MQGINNRNLYIVKKNSLSSIFLIIFFIVLFKFKGSSTDMIVLVLPLISYVLLSTVAWEDDLQEYDIILNSMPVTREDVINGKFRLFIVYTFINLAVLLAIHLLIKLFTNEGYMNIYNSIFYSSISFFVSTLIGSLYNFIVIKYGYEKSRIISIIIVYSLAFPYVDVLANININNNFYLCIISVICILFSFIIYCMFKRICIKIYQLKEF